MRAFHSLHLSGQCKWWLCRRWPMLSWLFRLFLLPLVPWADYLVKSRGVSRIDKIGAIPLFGPCRTSLLFLSPLLRDSFKWLGCIESCRSLFDLDFSHLDFSHQAHHTLLGCKACAHSQRWKISSTNWTQSKPPGSRLRKLTRPSVQHALVRRPREHTLLVS